MNEKLIVGHCGQAMAKVEVSLHESIRLPRPGSFFTAGGDLVD
jgi:hypothetical protein